MPRDMGFRRVAIRQLIDDYGELCASCGIEGVPLELDHIVPLFKGGKDEIANVQLLCHPCHAEKTAAERRQQLYDPTATRAGDLML